MSTVPTRVVNDSASSWVLERSITSDPQLAIDLIRVLLDELERRTWSDKDVFGIHMAMEEALMNAIKHGNCSDCKKQVHIKIELHTDRFQAQITDEGDGFDPECVPDPTLDENLERSCGRGVALIKNFVDEARYNEKGNSVELIKRREA